MPGTAKINTGCGLIVIVPVVPLEDDGGRYAGLLTESDREYLGRISSPARRAAGAAWRAVVRREGEMSDIAYNGVGAPLLTAPARWSYIGVSHSQDHAAVIFSDRPCAIDIENATRNFDRVASRYISAEENALPEAGHPLFRAAVWCAKEALYKYSGRRELDLCGDLRITATDLDHGLLAGGIRGAGGAWDDHPMKMLRHGDDLVVYLGR